MWDAGIGQSAPHDLFTTLTQVRRQITSPLNSQAGSGREGVLTFLPPHHGDNYHLSQNENFRVTSTHIHYAYTLEHIHKVTLSRLHRFARYVGYDVNFLDELNVRSGMNIQL